MNEHGDGRGNRDGSRPEGDDGGRRDGRPGADTRFLQIEQSEVLYSEAEAVVRPAFRELLTEAAKDRLRDRFGTQITALAELAVDDLLKGIEASLEIETRIKQNSEDRRIDDRLRELFAARHAGGKSRAGTARARRSKR
jgi:hypothetical protein